MSFIKVLPEHLETFSLTLHPETEYVSSSMGASGTMPLVHRPSPYWKELVFVTGRQYQTPLPGQNTPNDVAGGSVYDQDNKKIREVCWEYPPYDETAYASYIILDTIHGAILWLSASGVTSPFIDFTQPLDGYMDLVNKAPQVRKNFKKFEIMRFEPPFKVTSKTMMKNTIKNVLLPTYKARYDSSFFAYSNYNTLNFFTGSLVPSDSALIYPNAIPARKRPYSPSGSFSFDFYINPRYTNEKEDLEFKAGTLLHLSSSYVISLVSGSQKDQNGLVSHYRMMLQLSHSADIEPSSVDLNLKNNRRSYPDDLIFLSSDNSLERNKWHHVSIRWGKNITNDGTGSIIIDGNSSYFNVPSSSILPPKHVECDALVVGNYYSGFDSEAKFFNKSAAYSEGVQKIVNTTSDPVNFEFSHPLNAEIHDLKIFKMYLEGPTIKDYEQFGLPDSATKNLMFYLPPMFVKESPLRDVLITPYVTDRRRTTFPFNSIFSSAVGGHIINLDNFCRDFRKGFYPRLFNLTASNLNAFVPGLSANDFIYATGSIRKRNLTILPCDNGRFRPDYDLLRTGSNSLSPFISVDGITDMSKIFVDCVLPQQNQRIGDLQGYSQKAVQQVEDHKKGKPTVYRNASGIPYNVERIDSPIYADDMGIAGEYAAVTPENLGEGKAGSFVFNLDGSLNKPIVPARFIRTRDCSTDEVTIFNISNIYYGNTIQTNTFFLTDPSLTGSGGKVKITLRDNERGSLYRCDARGPHPTWANVGNVFYDHGLVIIKSPHVVPYGKDKFEVRFKGEQNIHIFGINVDAEIGLINSSSNPQYRFISASYDANDYDPRFVYITGVNLHDDNLNVIMRMNLAQPLKKRNSDEMLIRLKEDF